MLGLSPIHGKRATLVIPKSTFTFKQKSRSLVKQGGLYARIEPHPRKTSSARNPFFELTMIYMENIRLLWSRFVREDGTVNYRTPLESQVIHKYPISVAPDPSGSEQSTANI